MKAASLPKPPTTGHHLAEDEESPSKPVPPGRTKGVVGLSAKVLGAKVLGAQPAISVGAAFQGTAFGTFAPPDVQLAVGNTVELEMTNDTGEVFDRSGHLLRAFDLNLLFGAIQGTDPKVLFDPSTNLFFASFETKQAGGDAVNLALTSDPVHGTWHVYNVAQNSAGYVFDQPKLGISGNKVMLAWNDRGDVGPEDYHVVSKSALVAFDGSAPGTVWANDAGRLNMIPVISLSATSTQYAIYHNYDTSSVGVLAFTGVPGVSALTATETVLPVAPTSAPPAARQPGSTRTLESSDDRLQSAAWRDNTLWATGGDGCTYPGDQHERACVRLIKVSTSNGQIALSRDVDLAWPSGNDLMYPAVATSGSGDLFLSMSGSSPTIYPSSLAAEVPGGVIGSSVGGLLFASGVAPLSCPVWCVGRNRFGDYSGASVDPTDPTKVWMASEFGRLTRSGSSEEWATEIGRFGS